MGRAAGNHFRFGLLTLIAPFVIITSAGAQYNISQCTSLLQQLSQALAQSYPRQIVGLERQYLTYCTSYMDKPEYLTHLGTLATALNGDGQHREAAGIADRCLQYDPTELSCLFEKANALSYLDRLQEAKDIIESALALGAVTEIDAAVQQRLQKLFAQVNSALAVRRPEKSPTVSGTNERQPRAATQNVSGTISCKADAVGISIKIDGEITAKTAEAVGAIFTEYNTLERKIKQRSVKCEDTKYRAAPNDTSPYGSHYSINSNGGSVPAAMAIGRLFRKEGAWIMVERACISACVLLVAGAVDRHVGQNARIGIHRPYLGTTPEQSVTREQVKQTYAAMLQDLHAYLREMNVSERLADDMLATEPERVHFLTKSEMKEYRLTGIDPAEQQRRAIENEARDVQEANQLGLDRLEYTRRKALGDSLCASAADYTEFSKCKRSVLITGHGRPTPREDTRPWTERF